MIVDRKSLHHLIISIQIIVCDEIIAFTVHAVVDGHGLEQKRMK